MSRPVLFWGLLMCVLAAIGVVVFSFGGPRFPALMFGIGGVMVALALFLVLTGLTHNNALPVQSVPDVSPPTTWVAFGFVLMGLGAVAGLWLVWIGGGVVLTGLGGLVREGRAQRRAIRRAGEEAE